MRSRTFVLPVLALFVAVPALGQAPPLLPVQGTIESAGGTPVDGDVAVRFGLHTDEVGGTEVWFEDRDVTCEAGFFTVYLGEMSALDLDLFATSGPLWLGLSVEGEAETSRVLIATTGYAAFAHRAGDAASVGGLDADGLRDWNGLQGTPAGFADGVDNEGTPTTDAGQLSSGTLSSDRFSAYEDLVAEARLDNTSADDLVTRGQADGRYVEEGQGASVSAAMLQDGACLLELADDDGAGSGLDADTLDGRDSDALRPFVVSSNTSFTTVLTTTCANYANGEVTLVAPGPGTVVVEANAWLLLEHTSGTTDSLVLGIGTTPTDCGEVQSWVRWEIPAGNATDSSIDQTFTVRRAFTVSAGSQTYYLNGYMSLGQSSLDRFWFASLIATFYPD